MVMRRSSWAGPVLRRASMKGQAMDWVTFETEGGGLLKIQAKHVVAIYNELGSVKISTVAGGVHILAAGTTVSQAASMVGDIEPE